MARGGGGLGTPKAKIANSDEDSSSRDSESDAEVESAEEELQEQVADVPFELLQQARSSGQLPQFLASKKNADIKRANKKQVVREDSVNHFNTDIELSYTPICRPMEISSKKPVGRFREVIQAPKREVRDPRFESLCGNFEEARFKKSYSFLYDEELPAERQRLQKEVGKGRSGEDVEEAQQRLSWIDKQLREEEQRRKHAEVQAQQGSKERAAVKQGKKPFYPKKAEKRKEELVEKFQELKATGKLEKFVAKRRQKNASKDHRYVPYRRPQAN